MNLLKMFRDWIEDSTGWERENFDKAWHKKYDTYPGLSKSNSCMDYHNEIAFDIYKM